MIFTAEGAQVELIRGGLSIAGSHEQAMLGIRPEDMRIVPSDDPSAQARGGALEGRVVLVERLGGTSHVHFEVGPHRMMASLSSESLPSVGDSITVRVPAERVHLFGASGATLR